MTIPVGHTKNFNMLQKAFKAGQAAIMECIDKKTGASVTVLCMVNMSQGGFRFVPVAKFFDGNPYDELISPTT